MRHAMQGKKFVASLMLAFVAAAGSLVSTSAEAQSADVSVATTAPATAVPGTDVSFAITVANNGPDDAIGTSIIDSVPIGTTFVSFAQNSGPAASCSTPAVGASGIIDCFAVVITAGASADFTLVVHISPSATGGVDNFVEVFTASDPSPANDVADAFTPLSPSADLSVVKSGPASVNAASPIAYSITVADTGPSDAQSVTLSDPLPAGTTFVSLTQTAGPAFACTTPAAGTNGTVSCSLATLGASATASFTLTAAVDASALPGTSIVNTANVASTTADANAADNSASASSTVSPTVSFSGPSATGTGTITASFTGGGPTCSFADARLIPLTGDPASPPAGSAPPGVAFPQGLFTFTTTGCTPGATLAFTIIYPSPVAGRYWKYGPTPGHATASWYVLSATFSGNVVTFSITDGGLGDDDLAANGTVADQGGPGVGGVPRQVPTLSEWVLALLALLVAGAGMRRAARRRAPKA